VCSKGRLLLFTARSPGSDPVVGLAHVQRAAVTTRVQLVMDESRKHRRAL
jgi:hypothetical protein